MRTILETEHLHLRELNPDDLEPVASMLGDPEVMRYWPAPFTREQSEEWIRNHMARYERDGYGYWLALERATGAVAGQAGLLNQNVDGTIELGLGYIFNRAYWHQGLATEAARGCIDYALRVLRRDRLTALIRPENLPSRRVAERLGMRVERSTTYANYEHLIYVAPGSTGGQSD